MSWIRRTFSSSLGKKYLTAATGLFLVGYLVLHLAGNLLLFQSDGGVAFDAYAKSFTDNPLLPIAEIALAALFIAHIALALTVNAQNREARTTGYSVRASLGRKTLASSTMVATGIIVLLFLLVHVYDFRVARMFEEDDHSLAGMVRHRLSTAVGAGIYLVGVAALGLHLRHAFASAFQSLGANHPRLNPILARASWILAVVLGLGFAAFPIYYFLFRRGSP